MKKEKIYFVGWTDIHFPIWYIHSEESGRKNEVGAGRGVEIQKSLYGTLLSARWESPEHDDVLRCLCLPAVPLAFSPCASSAWPTLKQGKLSLTSWESAWTLLIW